MGCGDSRPALGRALFFNQNLTFKRKKTMNNRTNILIILILLIATPMMAQKAV